ncbi:MAG TPA: hypothetical protein VNZ62_05695 [Capillimicrobium sp.]|nr:hypothetical protein [Capillimicrobium sp.]
MPRTALLALIACVVLVAGCGGGDDDGATSAATATGVAAEADLGAIKEYLLEHSDRLVAETESLQRDAEAYHALAERYGFDYAAMLADDREQVTQLIDRMQRTFRSANPAYEEMEGVVAGVPALADYDVQIDAGADGSDPENAVAFTIETPAGRTFEQPGNFFFLAETSLWGTEERFVAEDVEPDLDGDGEVTFGEALPDADFLVAVARDFHATAQDLREDAEAWEPTEGDALTALVVMTPTMSEYFAAWKNSRAIAGEDATESGFVAASRLQDIADILGGLVLVYDNVRPLIAQADEAQAQQTGRSLQELHDFAARLRDEEADGKRFTAQDADTLGSEAQDRAEAIAGQITQAAEQLGIELQA